MRGAPLLLFLSICLAGIIPACAGSTYIAAKLICFIRDHPRMCGEHFFRSFIDEWGEGSSPHVRGAPSATQGNIRNAGIIPACAGSTSFPAQTSRRHRDHPRMCGEHCEAVISAYMLSGSSPHVRGAPRGCQVRGLAFGIIPACAGSTP